jgi:nucleotide sugar dehydrogenase
MIKYASNAYLATRISYINEIANMCEELGADIQEVARGMGLDKRIGPAFLEAGLGWGGSCFPKDVKALAHMAVLHGTQPQLLQAVMEINRNQRRRVVYKLRKALGSLNDRPSVCWASPSSQIQMTFVIHQPLKSFTCCKMKGQLSKRMIPRQWTMPPLY